MSSTTLPQRDRAQSEATAVTVHPYRDRVLVRAAGELNAQYAAEVRDECIGLLDRGFDRLVLDLCRCDEIALDAVGSIAVLDGHARQLGARVTFRLRDGDLADTLRAAGLRLEPELGIGETLPAFFDWSR